ncbi:MAG: restriction endonuclease subunit S [Bacilli bacterium]|jgi:type I restriction enzyme S subunit
MNRAKIGDLCNLYSGGTPSTKCSEYWGGNFPWLSSAVSNQDFIYSSEITITQEGIDNSATRLAKKNSVLIATAGEGKTRGQVSYLEIDAYINQSLISIVPKKDITALYLYYYLKNSYGRIRKLSDITGIRGSLSGDLLKSFIIEYPDLDTQKKITTTLRTIDRKIENNKKIINELESMSKTLYDYWFLQFEFPNKEGKLYRTSGGKMVWNEELKREIPEGWKVDNLMESSLCGDIKAGVDYFETKKYLPTANINGEEITDGEYISFDNRESRANMQPVKNSVWFAKMKNSIKHLTIPENSDWFINKYILSTGFQGLKCSEDSLAYIHCIINSNWFEVFKDMLSHGATQESVNNEDLKNIKFAVPSVDVLKRFSAIVFPILEKKFSIIKENQELTALRDFLLPLLMNGQVSFNK